MPAVKRKMLKPVLANLGIEAQYRAALHKKIDTMAASVSYWIAAGYKKHEPVMAQDEAPSIVLRRIIRALIRRWQKSWNDGADILARYFAQKVQFRTDAALKAALKQAGWAIKFTMTPAMRDILQATIGANVGLIRTIPQQYLAQVEGAVMRAAQTGGDLKQLTDDIEKLRQVTRRRAAFIALDQINKATASMTQARQLSLGFKTAIWRHSHADKEPRPTHIGNDNKPFDLKLGWFDPAEGKRILPGQLIGCTCFHQVVLPGTP